MRRLSFGGCQRSGDVLIFPPRRHGVLTTTRLNWKAVGVQEGSAHGADGCSKGKIYGSRKTRKRPMAIRSAVVVLTEIAVPRQSPSLKSTRWMSPVRTGPHLVRLDEGCLVLSAVRAGECPIMSRPTSGLSSLCRGREEIEDERWREEYHRTALPRA